MRPSASTRQCWRSTPRSRSRRCARSCAPSALTSRSSAPTGSCASSSTACRGTASSACSTFSSLSATPRCLHVRQLRAHCMRAWQRTRAARPARAGRPCAFQCSCALCAFAGSAVALCMYRVLHVATARGRARESSEIGGVRTEQRERERTDGDGRVDNPQVLLRAATAVLKLLQPRILACKTQVHDCIYMQLHLGLCSFVPLLSCARKTPLCVHHPCSKELFWAVQ